MTDLDDIFPEFMTATEPGPCLVCNRQTDQVSIDFECYLHPGMECEGYLWEHFYPNVLCLNWDESAYETPTAVQTLRPEVPQ